MIKTIVTGEGLTRALERQQRWVDQLGDATVDEREALTRARRRETERLTAENAEVRRRLRMAKARSRAEPR